SKLVIGPMPDRPSTMPFQLCSTPQPRGVSRPRPVTTTRRMRRSFVVNPGGENREAGGARLGGGAMGRCRPFRSIQNLNTRRISGAVLAFGGSGEGPAEEDPDVAGGGLGVTADPGVIVLKRGLKHRLDSRGVQLTEGAG